MPTPLMIKQFEELTLTTAEEICEQYKELSKQEKIIAAQKKKLYQQLVTNYFTDKEEIESPDGLILATYKSSIRCVFDAIRFKREQPGMYESYLEPKESWTLLVK